jgi:hypothetical protein
MKKNSDTAEPEEKPVDMTGFALLQIIAWANQEIIGCKTALEAETKSNVIAYLQGKIPGCKFLLNSLKDAFLLSDDFMQHNEVCDYANLSYEELLGAQIDIRDLEAKVSWVQFLARVEERASDMKEFLLFRAKKSRSMFEVQGKYSGMTTYKEVFMQIEEMIKFRKANEPLFYPDPGDPGNPGDPGTALVPTAGTGLAIRDQDNLPDEEDDGDINDDDDLDLDGFPIEGDPDLE